MVDTARLARLQAADYSVKGSAVGVVLRRVPGDREQGEVGCCCGYSDRCHLSGAGDHCPRADARQPHRVVATEVVSIAKYASSNKRPLNVTKSTERLT
jgi:hypothetical protein